MDFKQAVIVGAALGVIFFCVSVIFRLLGEIGSLRQQLKDAGRRYEQLYTAYVEACNANPNRPWVTTITQEQKNMPITMSQGDYLRYEAQEAQLRAATSGSVLRKL